MNAFLRNVERIRLLEREEHMAMMRAERLAKRQAREKVRKDALNARASVERAALRAEIREQAQALLARGWVRSAVERALDVTPERLTRILNEVES